MYPVSARFLATVQKSHVMKTRVDIYDVSNGKIIASPPVIDGEVTIDSRRSVRRQCSINFVDTDGTLVPRDPRNSILITFNREARIYRGLVYADGTEELVPLGVFSLTDVDITDTANGVQITVTGSDRSLRVAEAKFTDHSFYIPNATPKETAILNIIKSRYPAVVSQLPVTGQVTKILYPSLDQSSDPWKAATDIATSAGMDLYFDAVGTLRMRPIPGGSMVDGMWIPSAYAGRPAVTYTADENLVITQLQRKLSRQESYNGVIVTGEGTNLSIGVIGEAWDDDPSSPTYRVTYGEVPKFMSSASVLTSAEAVIAAKAELVKVIGATESLNWNQIVNPALDVFDVVQITRRESEVVLPFSIDSLTIPFKPDTAMAIVGKSRRFA